MFPVVNGIPGFVSIKIETVLKAKSWGWTKSWYNFSKQPFLTVVLGDFNVNSNRWCKSEKHHKKAQKLRA